MDCCNHQCEACHKHKERTPEEMKALINRLNRIEGQRNTENVEPFPLFDVTFIYPFCA